jgi:alkanesulfonate monooxygenase SsuD/methylene tetrahydromethanopterin reductase-like flavin-dependent oxidoreductase (luciferase family)
MVSVMRIGIGLPAAVPGATASALGDWAEASDRAGFASVSVLDRLVYDNLDPLVALAVAAARTDRVELLATVLNVPYRINPVLVAKQLASIDRLSVGRLTAGLALGGWPEDAEASGIELGGRGPVLDAMLATMRRVWDGKVSGAAGPMPALPEGRPGVLFGGLTPASFRRVASSGLGWVAPFFGMELLVGGIEGTRRAWSEVGRSGQPRIVAERYFCLGSDADRTADDYLAHYYGPGLLRRRTHRFGHERCGDPQRARTARRGRLRRRHPVSLLGRTGSGRAARHGTRRPRHPDLSRDLRVTHPRRDRRRPSTAR